jgi:hypothetical protein
MSDEGIDKLMREMIEEAAKFRKVPTENCIRVSVMLQTAANLIHDMRQNKEKHVQALRRISVYDWPGPRSWIQDIAKEALK